MPVAKSYLITGGAGFIGSHLAEKLIKNGHRVSVIDDLSTGRIENIASLLDNKNFTFIQASILDQVSLENSIKKVDEVFHLAAAVGVDLIVKKPLESLATNIRGSEIVLECCYKYNKKILVTSTSEIYGKNTSDSLSEEDDRILGSPLKTRWSYSEAKAIEEVLAYVYWRERNLPTVIVRLFNTVGPRQIGNYGMVIPRMVQQAIESSPITIFGDGNQKRCFCHVEDVVKALIQLMDHNESVGQVFNVGAEEEISISNLAIKIKEITNSKSEIVFIPYEQAYESGFEDMLRRKPSIKKINEHISWKPTKNLDEIIHDIVNLSY